jgi:hypothetical protein
MGMQTQNRVVLDFRAKIRQVWGWQWRWEESAGSNWLFSMGRSHVGSKVDLFSLPLIYVYIYTNPMVKVLRLGGKNPFDNIPFSSWNNVVKWIWNLDLSRWWFWSCYFAKSQWDDYPNGFMWYVLGGSSIQTNKSQRKENNIKHIRSNSLDDLDFVFVKSWWVSDFNFSHLTGSEPNSPRICFWVHLLPSDGPKMGHFSSWGLILVDILALPRFSAGLQVDHVITAPMFFLWLVFIW